MGWGTCPNSRGCTSDTTPKIMREKIITSLAIAFIIVSLYTGFELEKESSQWYLGLQISDCLLLSSFLLSTNKNSYLNIIVFGAWFGASLELIDEVSGLNTMLHINDYQCTALWVSGTIIRVLVKFYKHLSNVKGHG